MSAETGQGGVRTDEDLVTIDAGGGVALEGALGVPRGARDLVLFAHGSGSSRKSPRNNFVAQVLRRSGMATLLFDLLTAEEDIDYDNRFDIGLLTERLEAATDWASNDEKTGGLAAGYFGASTGAAAAIRAAADRGGEVKAVVSRGGRPDLAGDALERLVSPILLLVGARDEVVIDLNRKAMEKITGEKELVVVPGASHLFEEPGTLEEVSGHAAAWFKRLLA